MNNGRPGLICADHQRAFGVIFVLSGLVYCAQMTVVILHVLRLLPFQLNLGADETRDWFLGQAVFFAVAAAGYVILEWRAGRRATAQDAADLLTGYMGFTALFAAAAFGLVYWRINDWLGLAPGLFQIGYGAALCRHRPLVNLKRLGR